MAILPKVSEAITIRYDASERQGSRTYSEPESDLPFNLLDMLHPEWHQWAACRGRLDLFFPDKTDPGGKSHQAKKLCDECAVSDLCKEQWSEMESMQGHHGIWFGTSERERRGVRQSLNRRRERHGTRDRWRKGCRCAACSDGQSARVRRELDRRQAS